MFISVFPWVEIQHCFTISKPKFLKSLLALSPEFLAIGSGSVTSVPLPMIPVICDLVITCPGSANSFGSPLFRFPIKGSDGFDLVDLLAKSVVTPAFLKVGLNEILSKPFFTHCFRKFRQLTPIWHENFLLSPSGQGFYHQ